MVAVTLRDRAFGDVLADMVDGIVIANGLQEPAAVADPPRVARCRLSAQPDVGTIRGRLTLSPTGARVAERQTQAA